MKRYTYTVTVLGQTYECGSLREVGECCNRAFGAPIVSVDMLLNYFSRPHVVSKRLLGTHIQLSRVERMAKAQAKAKPDASLLV
jgi:hypothetical protein